MTLDGYVGTEFVLLSYDVRVAARSVAVRVCRIVFGRVRIAGLAIISDDDGLVPLEA